MRRLHVALLLLSMNSAGCVEEVSYAPPAEFAITLPIASFAVRNGASVVLPVVATRGPGMAGAIEVEVKQLPIGLTAAPAVIAPGATAARISLRADNAPTGFDVRFELEARDAAGRLARASAKVFVLGIEGQLISGSSAQRMHPRAAPALLPMPQGGVLYASPADARLLLRRADGLLDPSFGVGGIADYSAALAGLAPAAEAVALVRRQTDGKLLVITSYDDPATAAPSDGALLVRFAADGTRDLSSDDPLEARGVAIFGPGQVVRGAGLDEHDGLALWSESAERERMLWRISASGELLANRAVPADVELSRPELVVEPGTGQLVAAVPGGLVRFRSDLTRDLGFGAMGLLALGNSTPFLSVRSQGYLAGGSSFAGGDIQPTLWLFDEDWRLPPGFPAEGSSHPVPSGTVSNVVEDDEHFVAVAYEPSSIKRVWVIRYHRDGRPDLAFAQTSRIPGAALLALLLPSESFLGLVMGARGTVLTVFRDGSSFSTIGVWR